MNIKLRVEDRQLFYDGNRQVDERIDRIEEICCEELAKMSAMVPEYDYCANVGVTKSPEMVENMAMHDAYHARFMTVDYGKNPTWTDKITGCLVGFSEDNTFDGTYVSLDAYGLCIEVAIQCHGSPRNIGEIKSYLERLKNALKSRIFGT